MASIHIEHDKSEMGRSLRQLSSTSKSLIVLLWVVWALGFVVVALLYNLWQVMASSDIESILSAIDEKLYIQPLLVSACVFFVALCIAAVRMVLAWSKAKRETATKLEQSNLLEKLFSGQLEDPPAPTTWRLNLRGVFGKPTFSQEFRIAIENLDWYCDHKKRSNAVKFQLIVVACMMGTLALGLVTAIAFPSMVLAGIGILIIGGALAYQTLPIHLASSVRIGEAANIALKCLETEG